MLSEAKVGPGAGWRYFFRGVVVGDGRRPAGTPLRATQDEAGVPPGFWTGSAGTRMPTGSSASSWRRAPIR